MLSLSRMSPGSLALFASLALLACGSSDSGGAAGVGNGQTQPDAACGDPGSPCDAGAESSDEQATDLDAAEEPSTPDAPTEATAPDAAEAGSAPTFDCSKVTAGLNDGFSIDGIDRAFLLDIPDDAATAGPLPVVFNWHGLGDSAANMRLLLSGQVNGPAREFILVTPEDTAYKLSAMGMSAVLDWDAFNADDANREVRLYDEVLGCLQSKYSVDSERVHCVGFSIGAIVCDMIGTLRGDEVASAATYSGGYLNDPQNYDAMMAYVVKWPDYTVTNRYAQLFLHGGPQDTYPLGGLITIHFDQYAVNDSAFLAENGHDSVVCNHGQGHAAPAGFSAANLVQFLSDHPRTAQQSPYRSGLPTSFPSFCEFQQATD